MPIIIGKKKINKRFLVLVALIKLEAQKSYSNLLLNTILHKSNLDEKDRSFVSKLFYGTIEKSITLDYIISQYSRYKLAKISPEIRIILRMGLYQLMYMDKTPEYAILDETVDLAKKIRKRSASSFVNAVLRNFLKNDKKYKLPDKNLDYTKYLSVRYSCSEEIIKIWERDYGIKETLDMLESTGQEPNLYIRVNNTKITTDRLKARLTEEGIYAETVSGFPMALKLSRFKSIEENESYKLGLFHVQNLSSQIYCKLIKAKENDTICDVCAAPGGKTFTLAEILKNKGQIYAFDIYDHKLQKLRDDIKRLDLKNIVLNKRDARSNDNSLNLKADKVICDVPCSGLGTVKSKPEIKIKALSGLDNLTKLQYIILCKSADLVKDGGILFYSTCTLDEMENNNIVNKFLQKHSQFIPYDLKFPINSMGDLSIKLNSDNKSITIPISKMAEGLFFAAFKKIS